MQLLDTSLNQIKNREDLKHFTVGIVVSRFNESITQALMNGAQNALESAGVDPDNICAARVPGAVEIPIAAKAMLLKQQFDGLIALGAVIKGETYHFDYVCQQASDGLGQLSLESDTPISFGILMTETAEQAWERAGGSKGHMGQESAHVLLETMDVLHQIHNL